MKLTEEQLKELIRNTIQEEGPIDADDVKQLVSEELGESLSSEIEAKIAELAKTPKDEERDIKPDAEEVSKEIDSKGGYDSFAEFAKDVADAGNPHRGINPKLKSYMGEIQKFNERAKAAGDPTLEIGDPEQGGYLVPTEFANQLFMTGIEQSNFFSRATKIPMAKNSIDIPYIQDSDHSSGYVYSSVLLYWLDELGAKIASKPKFGKVNLRLNKLIGMAFASDELLEDSAVSIQPLLTDVFSRAFTWTLDNVALNGSGAGQPRGILSDPALITVSKESGQAATTIEAENIIKMYARMWPEGQRNAVWVANPDTFKELATMSLAVGTGGAPVYLPANGLSGKPYDTLMGKPLIFSEHAQSLGTLGDIFYIDWTQYLVGQKAGRGGVSFATSIHLKFDYDQTAFRWVMRIDGQGWWPSTITPRYSSDTISPFVVLEART